MKSGLLVNRSSSFVLTVALGFLAAACDFREAYLTPRLLPAVLRVENANAHDVDLYAIREGGRLRIARLWAGETGDVECETTTENGQLVLEVYAIGLNQTYRTPAITVLGHTYINLRVGEVLSQSTFTVNYGEDLDSMPSFTGETQ